MQFAQKLSENPNGRKQQRTQHQQANQSDPNELCPDAQRRNLLQSSPTTLDHCLSIGIRQQSEGRDRLVCFAKQSLRYGHPPLATEPVGGRGEFVGSEGQFPYVQQTCKSVQPLVARACSFVVYRTVLEAHICVKRILTAKARSLFGKEFYDSTGSGTKLPIVIGMFNDEPLLIDGIHRINDAANTGKEYIPFFLLTAEQTRAITVPRSQ